MSGEALQSEDLHIQVFTEHRTGMTAGMPEIVVKATHLPTGRVAYGCGERSQHANRAKAIEALSAAPDGVNVETDTRRIVEILNQIEKAKELQQDAIRACDNVEIMWQEARILALKKSIINPEVGGEVYMGRPEEYRLVREGEVILATDEVLDDDAVQWRPCPAIARGMTYKRGYQPVRRNTRTPCQYCGPGLHTGLPGGVCENCLGTGLDQPEGAAGNEGSQPDTDLAKHLAVLGRLEKVLPDVGINGWLEGVKAVRYAINALSQDPTRLEHPRQEDSNNG